MAPDAKPMATKSVPPAAMRRLRERRGSLPVVKPDVVLSLSPPLRRRSSSFGITTQVTRKPGILRDKQTNSNGSNSNSNETSPSLSRKSQNDLRLSFVSSSFSKHSPGLLSSSSERLRMDRSCDHSHDHHQTSGVMDHSCRKCIKAQLQRNTSKPQDELVFDYIHGEIKHRPKTAFGRTVHADNTPASPTTGGRKSKSKGGHDDEHDDGEQDHISADEFINQCIIDSQTPRIKTVQRPRTSSTFGQLLEEFLPGDNDKAVPELLELPPVRRRGRSNSLPVVPVWTGEP
mgnify:CR=1 FL=1